MFELEGLQPVVEGMGEGHPCQIINYKVVIKLVDLPDAK